MRWRRKISRAAKTRAVAITNIAQRTKTAFKFTSMATVFIWCAHDRNAIPVATITSTNHQRVPERLHSYRLLALERRFALLEDGSDAFFVVLGVVH